MSNVALSSGWQAVHDLQRYLEKSKWIDASSLAAEEALTDALDAFLSGQAVTDAEINRSFFSRRKNRRRRNRQREKLVKTQAEKSIRFGLDERILDSTEKVENFDFLQAVEHEIGADNFTLLQRIADGATYEELAIQLSISETSLRTKVCRIRQKARLLAA